MSAKAPPERPNEPTGEESYELLRKSEKFLNWDLYGGRSPMAGPGEKHFTPQELAEAWGVSIETIRAIFRNEPGVLKIGKPGTRTKRAYLTLRIPADVAERIHARLTA